MTANKEASRPPRRSWWSRPRLNVRLMMLIIAAMAAGFGIYDDSQRVRVVFINKSAETVRLVGVFYEGREVQLGPIGPLGRVEHRLRSNQSMSGIRASVFVVRPRGKEDKIIEVVTNMPLIHGKVTYIEFNHDSIRFDYDGR